MMTPKDAPAYAREICGLAPVIPVLVVDDVAHAVPLAEALVAGGLPVLEVTLRTPAALEVIRAMAAVEGGVVGAGTLLTPADVRGRQGGRRALRRVAGRHRRAPRRLRGRGAAAARRRRHACREAMRMLARGYDVCKFFPAEANGGAPALKSFAGPLPQMHFCPTGGVTPQNAPDYLALPNVLCVGGSWVGRCRR